MIYKNIQVPSSNVLFELINNRETILSKNIGLIHRLQIERIGPDCIIETKYNKIKGKDGESSPPMMKEIFCNYNCEYIMSMPNVKNVLKEGLEFEKNGHLWNASDLFRNYINRIILKFYIWNSNEIYHKIKPDDWITAMIETVYFKGKFDTDSTFSKVTIQSNSIRLVDNTYKK